MDAGEVGLAHQPFDGAACHGPAPAIQVPARPAGEVVVWSGDWLSFEALQRRAASGDRTAQQLAAAMPAHFIIFDVLQADGQETLNEPYKRRRAVLEELFTEHRLPPPWTLCPMTTDPAVAQKWLTSWTEVQRVW
ncbi:ATP-dependent DNA ligase [Streptomyces sp. NPDC054802]